MVTLAGALRSRQRLLLENLLLRQQLQVALRSQRRPRLRARDKLLWLVARRLHPNWRRHLVLVRPETVLRWHRQGWALFWRWRSGRTLGRPRVNHDHPPLRTHGHCFRQRLSPSLAAEWWVRLGRN
jgi:putative transposase